MGNKDGMWNWDLIGRAVIFIVAFRVGAGIVGGVINHVADGPNRRRRKWEIEMLNRSIIDNQQKKVEQKQEA